MTVLFLCCCFSVANHSISVCVCVQHMLAGCRDNQSRWQSLNATETRNQHHRPLVDTSSNHSRVFPCILSALQWISQREELEPPLLDRWAPCQAETQATSLCWWLAACAWWGECWNIWSFHLTHRSSEISSTGDHCGQSLGTWAMSLFWLSPGRTCLRTFFFFFFHMYYLLAALYGNLLIVIFFIFNPIRTVFIMTQYILHTEESLKLQLFISNFTTFLLLTYNSEVNTDYTV